MPNTKKVIVYLTDELDAWLEAKATQGYKKASLVRHVLETHVRANA